MNYFTHYWKNKTWEFNKQIQSENGDLNHIAGNLFRKRGVKVGDVVYVITVLNGNLFLCGKLTVGKICNAYQAAKDLGCKPNELWEADEHIIASNATKRYWDLEVPLEVTKQLRFISGGDTKSLKFSTREVFTIQQIVESQAGFTKIELDQQTLRGVRQLTVESAQKLDEVLSTFGNNEFSQNTLVSNWEENSEFISEETLYESGVEGNKTLRYTPKYERDPKLRKKAVEIHGFNCKVCGINFQKVYGEHGKDFIEVHHLKPLHKFEKPQPVNPATDMTVLCPNCHAMIHRKKNKTLTIDELKAIYKK